jgi:competence protein ComGC
MIEPEADRGNGPPVAPQPVLPYRAPEPRQIAGGLAAFAILLSLAFIPVLVISALVFRHPIVLLALVLPLAGLVLGLVARRDPAADVRARQNARTAALWGGGQLILIALVILLLPNLGRAREPANRIKCASNLRQIGLALQIYSTDHGKQYPPSFDELLLTGDIIPEAFVCPSSTGEKAEGATAQHLIHNFHQPGCCNYVYALAGPGLPASALTARHVLAYEDMTNHDRKGMNVLYGDLSTQWLARREAEHLIAELQAGHNPPRLLSR